MQAAAVSGTLHHPCMAIVFGCILLCSQKVFAEDAFRTHHHHHAKILHEDHATADSGCGYSGAKIVFTSLYGATAKAPWLNCAVESAMLKKGNDGVVVLTDNVEEFTASWPNSLPSPAVLVDIKSCFANTPLQPWLDSPQLASALFRQQNIADALRLAVIYKNGGTYLDLDIIALQDKAFSLAGALSAQKACTEGCEEGWLNNAYLSFPPQHPFMYQLLIAFVLKFEGKTACQCHEVCTVSWHTIVANKWDPSHRLFVVLAAHKIMWYCLAAVQLAVRSVMLPLMCVMPALMPVVPAHNSIIF
ncbi:TPA: Lactosylceramide 4-alpha-galactosyltransferase, variant 2 [Trebouxia sp. C0005]